MNIFISSYQKPNGNYIEVNLYPESEEDARKMCVMADELKELGVSPDVVLLGQFEISRVSFRFPSPK